MDSQRNQELVSCKESKETGFNIGDRFERWKRKQAIAIGIVCKLQLWVTFPETEENRTKGIPLIPGKQLR